MSTYRNRNKPVQVNEEEKKKTENNKYCNENKLELNEVLLANNKKRSMALPEGKEQEVMEMRQSTVSTITNSRTNNEQI